MSRWLSCISPPSSCVVNSSSQHIDRFSAPLSCAYSRDSSIPARVRRLSGVRLGSSTFSCLPLRSAGEICGLITVTVAWILWQARVGVKKKFLIAPIQESGADEPVGADSIADGAAYDVLDETA